MVENRPEGDRKPEFGQNGAVLNAPTMSDDLRAKYLSWESPKQGLSSGAKLIVALAIYLFGYRAGMTHSGTAPLSDGHHLPILPLALFCLGISLDRIIGKIKTLAARSNR